MLISQNIRKHRKLNNFTVNQMCEALGVTQSCYYHYEQGKRNPDVYTLNKIANVLGVSIQTLYDGVPVEIRELESKNPLNTSIDDKAVDYSAKRIAKRIKNRREELGASQRQLADAVNCDHTAICRIENGSMKINVMILMKIAAALRLSPVDLITDRYGEEQKTS